MKKTLAALAVLGAFAGSAMAADVTLYGALDTGFEYIHTKNPGEKAVDTFDMQTGWDTGNRWGLKGSEDLGNGSQVSFKLESGFNGYDNMVVYQTPRFAGLQLTAQYSFKTDSKASAKYNSAGDPEYSGDEGTSHAQRYASVGLSGEYGPASFAVGYELTKYGVNEQTATGAGLGRELDKDGQLVFLGGNYDFEVVQLFVEGQYFKHQTAIAGFGDAFEGAIGDVKGYGLHLGAAAPLGAGTLTAGLYYTDATDEQIEDKDVDFKYYGASARYNYPLSERTGVYAGAGYGQVKNDDSGDKTKVTQVYCGLVHTF